MRFWQIAVIVLPFYITQLGLCWTRPWPDYSQMPETSHPPIEDAPPGRRILWLNGLWDFRLARDTRWRRIRLPGVWNSIPGMRFYTGSAAYRRLFEVPEGWSLGRIFLRFRGVNYSAEVSIDGRPVGRAEGGQLPFHFEITDRVRDPRTRELEVRVSNVLPHGAVPGVTGWRNDGGVPAEVYLETVPVVHIADLSVAASADLKGRADCDISVRIENPDLEPRNYRIEIFSPQDAKIHEQFMENWTMQTIQHRFQLQFVSLWDIENPALYRCRVSMEHDNADAVEVRFGVRKAEFRGREFHLNGRRVPLRGVAWMCDHPETCSAVSEERLIEDVRLIKDGGFNLIRFGPMPPHPRMLELCDAEGLLAFAEIPVWRPVADDLRDPEYLQAAQNQLSRLQLRDRNHPCVVAWGIGGELDSSTDEAHWFVEHIAQRARAVDSRPLYISTAHPEKDICADQVDFIVAVITGHRRQWTRGLHEIVGRWAALRPDRPLFMFFSPIGAEKADGKKQGRWPEENQAAYVLEILRLFEEDPDVAGWVCNTLCDFEEPGQFAGPKPFHRLRGLLTERREKKLAYVVAQRYLREGAAMETPVVRERMQIPVLPYLLLACLAVAAVALAFLRPQWVLMMAVGHKNMHGSELPGVFMALFFIMFSALGWSVLLNRFFIISPPNLTGSIDMTFFALLSRILRSQWILYFYVYSLLVSLWIFEATMTRFALQTGSFDSAMSVAGALSMPDILICVPAFTRVPLWLAFILVVLWKLLIAVSVYGFGGALLHVLLWPSLLLGVAVFLVERRFRVLRIIKSMF